MSAERPEYPTGSNYPTQPMAPGVRGAQQPGAYPTAAQQAAAQQAAAQRAGAADTAGLVRGMQVWLADLDRKMAIRTKLLLGLAAIAIGISGAALYLAIEANRTTASQKEFAELELRVDELESRLGVTPTESELEDATGAIEGAAEDAEAAAEEAAGAAEEADAAAGAADEAAGAAGEAAGAADEAASGATPRDRSENLDEGAPPFPEIGTD